MWWKQLLKVKSILSFVAAAMFIYLVVTKGISGEIAMTTIATIFTYYFTKKDNE